MDTNKDQNRSSTIDVNKEQNGENIMDANKVQDGASITDENKEKNKSSIMDTKEKKEEKKDKPLLTLDKISLPKIRKTVHKVMKKYYNDKFYRTADIVVKIFGKLKIKPTNPNEKVRIRNQIYRWITTNITAKDSGDSKKVVLAEIEAANRKSTNKIKQRKNIEIIVFDDTSEEKTQKETTEGLEVQAPTDADRVCIKCKKCINEKETSIDQQNIIKMEIEEIPLIDLTSDDNEIKKEPKEDVSTKLIPNGTNPQVTSPEASYYAHYQPNMWWYPYYYQNYNYMPSTYLPTTAYSNNLNASNNYSNNLSSSNYSNDLNPNNNYYQNYYYQ